MGGFFGGTSSPPALPQLKSSASGKGADLVYFTGKEITPATVTASSMIQVDNTGPALKNLIPDSTTPGFLIRKTVTNTGIGGASGEISHIVAGTEILKTDASGLTTSFPMVGTDANTPHVAFDTASAQDTPVFQPDGNATFGLGGDSTYCTIIAGGAAKIKCGASTSQLEGGFKSKGDFSGETAGSYILLNETSSGTNPTVVPNKNDETTGVGGATGELDLIVGGSRYIHITGSQNDLYNAWRIDTSISSTGANGGRYSAVTASQTVPSFIPNQAFTNAGMGGSGGGVSLISGGVEMARFVTGSGIDLFDAVTISGNLTVNGTTTSVDSTTVEVADPLFKYAKGNTVDTVDIGFYGEYDTGSTAKYAGLFRDAGTNIFRLFTGLQEEPTSTVNTGGTGYTKATLVADIDGLVVGTDVQAHSDRLDEIAALATGDGNIIVGSGASWVVESGSTARASLGLGIGTDVQAHDGDLDTIAALAKTQGNIIIANGSNWVAENGDTARTSLGLAIGTDVQAHDTGLDEIAALTPIDGDFLVSNGTNWIAESGATARTSLALGTTNAVQFQSLQLNAGTSANEISTDGTLAGNSDDAIPTEKAVKTYADTTFGAVTTGTWTPNVNGHSSYTGQDGWYIKVGDLVTVHGYIDPNTAFSGAGDFIIDNLPYPVPNQSTYFPIGGVSGDDTDFNDTYLEGQPNSSNAKVRNTGASTYLSLNDVGGTTVSFQLTYYATMPT